MISKLPKFRPWAAGIFSILLIHPATVLAQPIEPLATIKQWPGVSQLIAYKERIWFVSSQPFADTNVADIYSYSPQAGEIRYERSLFSQDVGNPVIHNGFLHWPFEDPRRSAGTGEYAVTDGVNWHWNIMQSGSVMHVHAMNSCNDQLTAVTGSWTGQLHVQGDDGLWSLMYEYPSGAAPFSRLVNIDEYNGSCILAASANGKDEAKLFRMGESSIVSIEDWPASDRVDALTPHKQSVYAFADSGSERLLLRYDGTSTTQLSVAENHRPRALHSDGQHLWMVTQSSNENDKRGHLWKYTDKHGFESVGDLDHTPIALTSAAGVLYIGSYHKSGGMLWRYPYAVDKSPTGTAINSNESQSDHLLPSHGKTAQKIDKDKAGALFKELSGLIEDPALTANYARKLRREIGRHAEIKSPEFGDALMRLLGKPLPSTTVKMFTDEPVSEQDLIRWYLINTLAINGYGRIPPEWINAESGITSDTHGKLFDPSVAAIVASGWLNQNDPATIDALVKRLNRSTDPLWLKADVIGALSHLTRQSFAYNIDEWNRWWQQQ